MRTQADVGRVTLQNGAMPAYEGLEARLLASKSAPFLFVGAGLSRRYLNIDGWVDLLKRMAAHTGRPYSYYATKASNNLPRVASEIAIPFHEVWFSDKRFDKSRVIYADQLTTVEGPLKAEVARYTTDALKAFPRRGQMRDELDLLGSAVIDGIISTNYDALLERVFPDFVPFVGQDELLFSEPQGIGEIYKIHGSATHPESLVLTEGDYEQFNLRNPYLAAKLLTTFVEHPVIFLGYSLTDEDVTSVLVSIAQVLTTENLGRLRDRLIFVRWDPAQTDPTMVSSQIAVSGFAIPVVLLTVASFGGLFEVLSRLPRRFPARLLRRLKEHVYELVLTKQPDTRLTVVDIEDDTHADEIDVVFGVGVRRRLSAKGYGGLTRADLLTDAVSVDSDLESDLVVTEALRRVLSSPANVPIYRHLRGAGLLNGDGTLQTVAVVDPKVRARVARGRVQAYAQQLHKAERLRDEAGGDFDTLAATQSVPDVLSTVLILPRTGINLDSFRAFLETNAAAFDAPATTTAWAKAVCLYDFYMYGDIDGGA